MTVIGTYVGNLTLPANSTLATTSKTTIYTATDDSETVASWNFANDTAGAVTCYIYYFNAVDNLDYLIWVGIVATKDTRIISDSPIRLRDGDKIKAQATATGIVVTLTKMLQFALTRT